MEIRLIQLGQYQKFLSSSPLSTAGSVKNLSLRLNFFPSPSEVSEKLVNLVETFKTDATLFFSLSFLQVLQNSWSRLINSYLLLASILLNPLSYFFRLLHLFLHPISESTPTIFLQSARFSSMILLLAVFSIKQFFNVPGSLSLPSPPYSLPFLSILNNELTNLLLVIRLYLSLLDLNLQLMWSRMGQRWLSGEVLQVERAHRMRLQCEVRCCRSPISQVLLFFSSGFFMQQTQLLGTAIILLHDYNHLITISATAVKLLLSQHITQQVTYIQIPVRAVASMSNNRAIQIILRIRPHQNYYQGLKLDNENNEITIAVPKDQSQGYINNQRESLKFKFDQIFDISARQEKVFDRVAKDVVEAAVEGYNGTIFAYGQTGSGKTYTMTGADSDDGMGIIPRTLRYIFFLAETKNIEMKVKIRYMQIYNGTGYDLLDPNIDPDQVDKVKMLEDLNRVKPMETGNGDLKLDNLSVHSAKTQQDALDLLFIGETNRVTCTTLKNDQSTRSHCIFMINLQTSRPGSEVKSVAAINLVDLSGSEKLKATDYEQRVEKEAISINLGLHYLQRLIVELNKKMNGENVHVPYRQSLMNLVLRDSIGGNCITRMVATMSPKMQDMWETISTCKFAQRVALIKNNIQRNETVDPAIIIARLKRQNAQLKAELALLKGQDVKEELDKWQIEDCHKAAQEYLQSDDPSATLIMSDRLKINECFYFFKNIIKKGGANLAISNASKVQNSSSNQSNMVKKGPASVDEQRYEQQIKKLKLAVQARDNEIALLLSLINKKRGGNALESLPVNRMKPEEQQMMKSVVKEKPIEFAAKQEEDDTKSMFSKATTNQLSKIKKNNYMDESEVQSQNNTRSIIANRPIETKEIQTMLIKPLNLSNEDLLDHAKAFQAFRVSSRRHEAMQKNAEVLQGKIKQGKQIAMQVHQAREKVGKLKQQLQKLQRENAVKNLVDGIDREDPEQQAIREQIVKCKQVYQENSMKLKGIKVEIENIQHLQKKNVEQLEKDFLKYVKFKQQERETTISGINSSMLVSNVKDKEVQKHLESFLKAREQIRKR